MTPNVIQRLCDVWRDSKAYRQSRMPRMPGKGTTTTANDDTESGNENS